jgi:hypothetical protein
MASILKVDTITGVSTAGSIAVTGEGNSTTTNLQQGLAKVWCAFNGTGTIAVRDSFNTASLTDNGTGTHTVNYTSAIATVEYAVTTSHQENQVNCCYVGPTVSSVRVDSRNDAGTYSDIDHKTAVAHGDLA